MVVKEEIDMKSEKSCGNTISNQKTITSKPIGQGGKISEENNRYLIKLQDGGLILCQEYRQMELKIDFESTQDSKLVGKAEIPMYECTHSDLAYLSNILIKDNPVYSCPVADIVDISQVSFKDGWDEIMKIYHISAFYCSK